MKKILTFITALLISISSFADIGSDISGSWRVDSGKPFVDKTIEYVKSLGSVERIHWNIKMSGNDLKIESVTTNNRDVIRSITDIVITNVKVNDLARTIDFDAPFLAGLSTHYKIKLIDANTADVSWETNSSQSGSFKLVR
jgi:hypothetical protein